MSSITKTGLLAGVSAFAVSLVLAPPALAFATVDWTWDAAITETIVKDVVVNIDIAPTDMTMVESFQSHFGNVIATSDVSDITNNQASSGGTLDGGTIDFQFHYGLGVAGAPGEFLDDEFKNPKVLFGSVNESDDGPNGINGTVIGTIGVGEITVPGTASLAAATELGSVTSAATAVANNLGVDSDTALQLHIEQFAVDFAAGEGQGALQTATINARSTVDAILNASVDSSATAVANNVGVRMAANGMILADMVQLAYADVSAVSRVTNVTLANYTGLGALTRPIVGSLATAIGNNALFTVRGPVVSVQ